jgi:hypothetical protein
MQKGRTAGQFFVVLCCEKSNKLARSMNTLRLSGGYGHSGEVLNHKANGTWGIQAEWEFDGFQP